MVIYLYVRDLKFKKKNKGFRYSLEKRVSVKYDRMTIMYVKYGVLNHILYTYKNKRTYLPTYKTNRFRFLSMAYEFIISKKCVILRVLIKHNDILCPRMNKIVTYPMK
jgi:hypothetical protein